MSATGNPEPLNPIALDYFEITLRFDDVVNSGEYIKAC
jgi:hypothetical protein